jgi:hypothetical protein
MVTLFLLICDANFQAPETSCFVILRRWGKCCKWPGGWSIASRTRSQMRVRNPRRKIQDGERGGVGMGALDSDVGSSVADAGSHPDAAHARARMRARIGGVGISLRSYK